MSHLQTTGGKDEPNIAFIEKSERTPQHGTATYKQLEVKTNRTSFLWRNRNGHHNTELRT